MIKIRLKSFIHKKKFGEAAHQRVYTIANKRMKRFILFSITMWQINSAIVYHCTHINMWQIQTKRPNHQQYHTFERMHSKINPQPFCAGILQ